MVCLCAFVLIVSSRCENGRFHFLLVWCFKINFCGYSKWWFKLLIISTSQTGSFFPVVGYQGRSKKSFPSGRESTIFHTEPYHFQHQIIPNHQFFIPNHTIFHTKSYHVSYQIIPCFIPNHTIFHTKSYQINKCSYQIIPNQPCFILNQPFFMPNHTKSTIFDTKSYQINHVSY